MRNLSIAAATLIGVTGLAASQPLYNFARANTSEDQFRNDRSECIAKAKPIYVGVICSTSVNYASNNPSGPPQMEKTTSCYGRTASGSSTGTSAILACMQAKGYQRSAPSMPAGRPGLYELRKFSNLAMATQPYIATALPMAQRRASADALAKPGPVLQICVPPNGSQPLSAIAGLSNGCTYSNIVSTQFGFAADARCQGGRTLHITFENQTADRSEFTVTGERIAKTSVPQIDKYQINRVSADCGTLPPRSVRMPDGQLVTMANTPVVQSFETTLP